MSFHELQRAFALLYMQSSLVLMVQSKSDLEIKFQLSELKALLKRFEHYLNN